MFRWVTIGVLFIALIGVGVWGYQEQQEKNAILIQAENNYQRAFHELTYYMDMLHDDIGTALAMNSDQRLSPKFVDIWRVTSQALTNVGQLPLGLLPFNKTEEFLSDIGDFTYRTAVRNLDDEPLSEDEVKVLEDLYAQADEIKNELRYVQHTALENNLRWMDVQLALVNNEPGDNTIINGFKTVEKSVEGYSEANNTTGLIGVSSQNNRFKHLNGNKISEEEAASLSKKIFELDSDEQPEVTESGEGADTPIYSISYRDDDKRAYMDLTQKGGHPLTVLVERPVNEKKLSLHEGAQKAIEFLEKFEFEGMELYQSAEYNRTGMYSFLYNLNGIRVYADSLEVKVALDNGDILGLTALDYFNNHYDRKIDKAKLSEKEAVEFVNPNIEIHEKNLAIIENELGEEVLAYEFLGTLGDDTYRIFINAMNGIEESVEKLGGQEINYAL